MGVFLDLNAVHSALGHRHQIVNPELSGVGWALALHSYNKANGTYEADSLIEFGWSSKTLTGSEKAAKVATDLASKELERKWDFVEVGEVGDTNPKGCYTAWFKDKIDATTIPEGFFELTDDEKVEVLKTDWSILFQSGSPLPSYGMVIKVRVQSAEEKAESELLAKRTAKDIANTNA